MSSIDVLSTPSAKRWPLRDDTNEDVALHWRFLQLRRPELQQRLRMRSKAGHALRCFLQENEFVEVETPTLVASSPEGAREFLVPTRQPGQFFALAQSPQQFKVKPYCTNLFILVNTTGLMSRRINVFIDVFFQCDWLIVLFCRLLNELSAHVHIMF
jgi:aspartyl/asparaginyl-tRNA synthetase